MNVYVATSWRNKHQPTVVTRLRTAGYEVYDFRNPEPGDTGFAWSDIDPDWESWTTAAYTKALEHPIAVAGFRKDMDALRTCNAVVLVLPSGRSAHLEAGWAAGDGKPVFVYQPEACEPELMAKMLNGVFDSLEPIIDWLGHVNA